MCKEVKIQKMKAKSFFIFSIIAIAIIAVITSYISVLYLSKPILMASTQKGYINLESLTGGSINVVVADTDTIVSVSNIINFGTVSKPATLYTAADNGVHKYPFVVRNIGSEVSYVCLKMESPRFLTATNSKAYLGVEPGKRDASVSGPWASTCTGTAGPTFPCVFNCGTVTSCYTQTGLNYQMTPIGTCSFPGTLTGCLDLFTSGAGGAFGTGSDKVIIKELYPPNVLNRGTDALLQVYLYIDAAEPSAAKQGIITITGKQDTGSQDCTGIV
jgi:hypothetical protein